MAAVIAQMAKAKRERSERKKINIDKRYVYVALAAKRVTATPVASVWLERATFCVTIKAFSAFYLYHTCMIANK